VPRAKCTLLLCFGCSFRPVVCRSSPCLQWAMFGPWPESDSGLLVTPPELRPCKTIWLGDVLWAGVCAGLLGEGPVMLG